MYCAQTAEDIDTISVSLPGRVKIWLTLVNPFLPKFCPVTHPCIYVDLNVGDIRWLITAE